MRTRLLALGLGAALAFVGCGGGSGGKTVTVMLSATDALTGEVTKAGNVVFHELQAGDILQPLPAGEVGIRAFVSFDLSSIPTGARVLSATLRLTQSSVGGSPYLTLGTVVVDQVEYGTLLEAGAYDRTFPIHQGFATLSTDATIGPKEADVSASVIDDFAVARGRSQFRIRFQTETDGDGGTDAAEFDEPTATHPPVLIVTYQT
jgi:hypothetical protein